MCRRKNMVNLGQSLTYPDQNYPYYRLGLRTKSRLRIRIIRSWIMITDPDYEFRLRIWITDLDYVLRIRITDLDYGIRFGIFFVMIG